jgi:lysylphosphatidylglycerol synthase-like protein
VKAADGTRPEASRRAGSRLRFAASLALSVGLCALLLRSVDPRDVVHAVTHVERGRFALYVALALAGLAARAFRYRMLLGARVGYAPLVLVTAARNFLVDLLPARVGSLSYVVLLTRRFGAPLEPVVSSFVLTFLYDLFAMTILVGIAVALELGRFEGGATVGALAVVLALGVLLVFLRLAPILRWTADVARRRTLPAVAARIVETANEVEQAGGLARAIPLLGISVVIRLLKFGAYWALLLGVVHEQGIGTADLPFWRVFLGISAAELSATLPIHGIAGFGTYETAWALGFERLGIPWRVAIVSGFATHLLSQLCDYSIGVVALAVVVATTRAECS